jgi:chromosome segregation ATPase
MHYTQADESEEAAERFLELSAALEEAEMQLADNEAQLHSLQDIRQQLQQQASGCCCVPLPQPSCGERQLWQTQTCRQLMVCPCAMQEEAAEKQLAELRREVTEAQEAPAAVQAQAQQLQQQVESLQGSANKASAVAEAAKTELNAAREAASHAEAEVTQLRSAAEEARQTADSRSSELSEAQQQLQVGLP